MIDTLIRMLPKAGQERQPGIPDKYVLVTLHRPSNVDDVEWLGAMLDTLAALSQELPVIFPIHPRTRDRMQAAGFSATSGRILFIDPVPYLGFLALQKDAVLVITRFGGIQEETTFLQVPCLTVRENTERPITVELSTNQLVGRNLECLRDAASRILSGTTKPSSIPPMGWTRF